MNNKEALLVEARSGNGLWIGMFEQGVEDPDGPHCTLLFCGQDLDGNATQIALQAVHDTMDGTIVLGESKVGGIARFAGFEDKDPIVYLMQDPAIRQLRERIVSKMVALGWERRKDDFDYTPHVTLTYIDKSETFKAETPTHPPFRFVQIAVACGAKMQKFNMIESQSPERQILSELSRILC